MLVPVPHTRVRDPLSFSSLSASLRAWVRFVIYTSVKKRARQELFISVFICVYLWQKAFFAVAR